MRKSAWKCTKRKKENRTRKKSLHLFLCIYVNVNCDSRRRQLNATNKSYTHKFWHSIYTVAQRASYFILIFIFVYKKGINSNIAVCFCHYVHHWFNWSLRVILCCCFFVCVFSICSFHFVLSWFPNSRTLFSLLINHQCTFSVNGDKFVSRCKKCWLCWNQQIILQFKDSLQSESVHSFMD